MLKGWGVDAKKEQYGTWNAWKRGWRSRRSRRHALKPLDATMLSWSGNTNGQWVEGGVVILEPYENAEQYRAWLPTVKGKVVLVGAPRLSCRMPDQVNAFGTPGYIEALNLEQNQLTALYRGLNQRIPTFYQDVKAPARSRCSSRTGRTIRASRRSSARRATRAIAHVRHRLRRLRHALPPREEQAGAECEADGRVGSAG
jgi:hypothetical protein